MSTNKRIAKRLLSAILTMLMLVSMVSIGMASASAATLELADTGVNLTGGEVLYLKPSDWTTANARFAVYFFNDTTSANSWVSMTKTDDTTATIYQVTVPTGDWAELIFCRMDPATTENNWDNKWNQSADLTWGGTSNCWGPNSNEWDGATGTWSTYTPPVVIPEYTVTFNEGHFKATGEAKVTEGEDYSFTVEATSGYEITKVTCNGTELTATDGTYTVADVNTDLDIEITATEIVVVTTYSVMFVDDDGTVLSSETVEEGAEAKVAADPVKAGYFFTGWTPAPEVTRTDDDGTKWFTVTGNAVFTAQYEEDNNDTPIMTLPTESEEEEETSKWTVMFVDYDNTLLKIAKVEDGKAAEAPAEPTRAGYEFKGWSVEFDNVTADLLVVAQYDKITVPVEPATHGKLQFAVTGGTGFTIAINDGVARPQGTIYSNSNVAIGSKVTVVANASSDAEFIGWMHASLNMIVSTEETFTFTTIGNDFYKAVYASDVENAALVVFKNDKANQIVDMQYYTAEDAIYVPAIPEHAAYEATEWTMTETDIQAAIATGEVIVATPKWTAKKIYVDVEVIGGTLTADQNDAGQTRANFAATATADPAAEGMQFAYWAEVVNGKNIVKSYDSTYKFFPSKAMTLKAIYIPADQAIDYKVLINIDGADTSLNQGTMFTYSWYVPEEQQNITYVNAGILFVAENDYSEETFVLNGSDKITTTLSNSSKPANTYTQGKGMTAGQTFYAKAFVQYTDAEGTLVTVYSDTLAVTKY